MKSMVRFPNRVWRILIQLEKLSGYWPDRSRTKYYILRICIVSILSSYVIPLVLRIMKEWHANFYIVLENILVISMILIITTKILVASLFQNLRHMILEQIKVHFETIHDEEEADILNDHSNKGWRLTIMFAVYAMAACGIYDCMPTIEMYFYHFFENGTLEKQIPLYLDYHVNEQEYFFHIMAHTCITLTTGLIAEFSFDLTFFTTVQHICGLFEIVKLRVKTALEIFEDLDDKLLDLDERRAYKIISSALDLHNEALQLARSFDVAYNISCFIVLLLNMLLLAPVMLTVLNYMHDPFKVCKYFVASIMVLAHFYVIFLQGQLMIDHSSSVFIACYDSSWYIAPRRTKIAISIMMRQSLVPCKITGGHMFVLSMETYGKMMKTGFSYFTIFATLEY